MEGERELLSVWNRSPLTNTPHNFHVPRVVVSVSCSSWTSSSHHHHPPSKGTASPLYRRTN